MTRDVIVAASILAADFSNLQAEVVRAEKAGADWLHMDIMDGHFVDNISFGPVVVDAVRKVARLPLDVHLMIDRADHYFSKFIPSASNITIHVETAINLPETLRGIRKAGCTAGLSLNPATPFDAVVPYLDQIDLLLVMTVVPGFGGQKFMSETMQKVKAATDFREQHNLNYRIEVDGGINAETAGICRQNGADTFVAGVYLFHAKEMAAAIQTLREPSLSPG